MGAEKRHNFPAGGPLAEKNATSSPVAAKAAALRSVHQRHPISSCFAGD
jgi:hypothetical protein